MFGTSCPGSRQAATAAAGGHGRLGGCMGTLRPRQAPRWRQGWRRSWQGHGKEAGAGSRRRVCFQASDKAGFSCFSGSPGSGTAAWASSCRTSTSPGPRRALSSQNQTPTPSCIACGEGARPSAAMQRALCLFPWGELPPNAFPPHRAWSQGGGTSRATLPSFLGDRNTKLGFCWRATGWGGGSPAPALRALTRRCPSLCWQRHWLRLVLTGPLACGKVSCTMALPVCKGKRWPRAWEPPLCKTEAPVPSRQCGGVVRKAWREVSKKTRARDARCTVRRAARLAGGRIPREPALQELTDLNSSDFFPLFI